MPIRPFAAGGKGHDPQVAVQLAQLMRAARLIENADYSPLGARLLAAWHDIDADHPDATTYTRLVAETRAERGGF
jgi:hypothetical protein